MCVCVCVCVGGGGVFSPLKIVIRIVGLLHVDFRYFCHENNYNVKKKKLCTM